MMGGGYATVALSTQNALLLRSICLKSRKYNIKSFCHPYTDYFVLTIAKKTFWKKTEKTIPHHHLMPEHSNACNVIPS